MFLDDFLPDFLLVLGGICFILSILGALWPRVFSLAGEGRRESRPLGFSMWCNLAGQFLSFRVVLTMQAKYGWSTPTIALTVWVVGVFAFGMWTLWKATRPHFSSRYEELAYEMKTHGPELSLAEVRQLHAEMREEVLRELAQLEERLLAEKPEGWQELQARIQATRLEWQEAPEKMPHLYPPKLRP